MSIAATKYYSFPFAEAVSVKPASKSSPVSAPKLPAIRTSYLHDVVNDTKSRAFCGPTAVASITGEKVSRVRDAYRLVRHGPGWPNLPRAPAIMRAPLSETEQVLRLFGYVGVWHEVAGRPTLAAYLKGRTGVERTHPCVVLVTRHYVAVSGWLFCDTFSKGLVVDADAAPQPRKRVQKVFVITGRIPPAAHIPSKAPSPFQPRDKAARNLDQLLRKAIKAETGGERVKITSDGDVHIRTSRYSDWDWIGGIENVQQSLLEPHGVRGSTPEAAAYRAAVNSSS